MFKRFLCLFFVSFTFLQILQAQKNGILPLTGIRYFNEGIWAKNIDVNVDGSNLLSDRVGLNKEIEIKLQLPVGFTPAAGNFFAGAEVTLLSSGGAVLSKTPNVFNFNEAKGFPAAAFKELIVKVGLRSDIIRSEPSVTIQVRFFDLKSKNQLRLEFPVTIARPGEPLQVSKLAVFVKTTDGSPAITSMLKIKTADVTVDTSIRVNPKMAYISLDIPGIEGTSMDEVLSGTETFWVYDEKLNSVKTADKLLKKVGGSMENSIVNYVLKIPYKLKTSPAKNYVVRFRWESKDRKKILDIVVTK
ncbi:hypothetical protein [Ferruginibacter sp. HRS2-29]|uniref:hypothetical protein n=1 Tax=Ferruginibacter sp. HRS2-29 TaxID=2487334 RepID=UPI0020CF92A4|nr:hypothetical protein [Ferruginibacter sp. HRS2-29]MCP9752465.1 hypothetical protein [Ferruginibacter sp. HRS2-29]